MYNSIELLKKDLEYQEKQQVKYLKAIKGLSKGGLSSYVKKGKIYYAEDVIVDGERKRKYIGNDEHPRVIALKERKFLDESLKRIDGNRKAINYFLKNYKSIFPQDIFDDLPRAYNVIPEMCFDMAGVLDLEKWKKSGYRRSEKYPENLRHTTNRGEKVRSKSEVIIANAFAAHGIEYRYEEIMWIGGIEMVPDFQVFSKKENRVILWEHFGLINDLEYLENCLWKIKHYIQNGYIPWRDIIFTFDDKNGNLNTMDIENIIKAFIK